MVAPSDGDVSSPAWMLAPMTGAGGKVRPKLVSDLPADLPVTDAEITLVVAMLGGADAFRRKLVEPDGDDAVATAHRPSREPTD